MHWVFVKKCLELATVLPVIKYFGNCHSAADVWATFQAASDLTLLGLTLAMVVVVGGVVELAHQLWLAVWEKQQPPSKVGAKSGTRRPKGGRRRRAIH